MVFDSIKLINCIGFWDRVSEFWVDDNDFNFTDYYITIDGYDYSINYDGKKLTVEDEKPKDAKLELQYSVKFTDIAKKMDMNVEFNWR